MDKDGRNRKHGRSTFLWKRNVFRLELNESRGGFCRRGKGRSFPVDGPKTEKAREPTVDRGWCEESGGCEYQKRSGEYGRACKVEDSHRDIRRSSARNTFIAESVYLVLNCFLHARIRTHARTHARTHTHTPLSSHVRSNHCQQ